MINTKFRGVAALAGEGVGLHGTTGNINVLLLKLGMGIIFIPFVYVVSNI